ncbi:hypothetical protein FWH58_02300 [Candidatus Saccharibacteria bacterium]|nr:hypothetical protein [Candidatus Saccharibacteria bacterium]
MNKTTFKSIIAVDIDDVLAQYTPSVVAFASAALNINIKLDDVTENWGSMFGLSQEEWIQYFQDFLKTQPFDNPATIVGAHAVLIKLKKKFDLVALTSRPVELRTVTLNWIEKHYRNIFSEVIFAGLWDEWLKDADLHDLAQRTKADILLEIGADCLIDDQPKHVNGAAKLGIKGLLFGDYGWNRDTEIADNVTRVADWGGVADYFGV